MAWESCSKVAALSIGLALRKKRGQKAKVKQMEI